MSRFISCNAIGNQIVEIAVFPCEVVCNGMQGAMQMGLNKSCNLV